MSAFRPLSVIFARDCEFWNQLGLRSVARSGVGRRRLAPILGTRKTIGRAHEFDGFVELAARELGLRDFDCVKFRSSNDRLERWRRLVEFFQTRQGAEKALRRAILKELMDVFGARG